MKKIFTLVFAIAMLSTAFAQHGQKGQRDRNDDRDDYAYNDKHDYDKRDHGHNDWYVFTPRERDMQIAQINHEYDHKIDRVKQQYYGGWFHKSRQIRSLEDQRNSEVQAVIFKFNDRKNKFGDFGREKKGRR